MTSLADNLSEAFTKDSQKIIKYMCYGNIYC